MTKTFCKRLNLGKQSASIFTNRLQRPLQAVSFFDIFETKYDELLGKLKLKSKSNLMPIIDLL